MFLKKKTMAATGDWIVGGEGGSSEIPVVWTRVMAVKIKRTGEIQRIR